MISIEYCSKHCASLGSAFGVNRENLIVLIRRENSSHNLCRIVASLTVRLWVTLLSRWTNTTQQQLYIKSQNSQREHNARSDNWIQPEFHMSPRNNDSMSHKPVQRRYSPTFRQPCACSSFTLVLGEIFHSEWRRTIAWISSYSLWYGTRGIPYHLQPQSFVAGRCIYGRQLTDAQRQVWRLWLLYGRR